MPDTWQQFLQQRGGIVEDGAISHFGDPQSEIAASHNANIMVDLSNFGPIRISGKDSATFLQGQFSNDVRNVDPAHSQLSSYNSPKGRILALFRLLMVADDYYMLLPTEVLESTLKRLSMFVMRSEVTLQDQQPEMVTMGLSGPNSEALLGDLFAGALPNVIDEAATSDGVTAVRLSGLQPRFLLFGECHRMQSLWDQLRPSVQCAASEVWRLLDIQSGIPSILPATSDAFVPQMLNLQLINGISFTKGCYTGQEVVSRMKYLGKLKRRMYRAHVGGEIRPQPGETLHSPGTTSNQGAGKVIMASAAPAGGYDLLLVADIATLEEQRLHLGSADGAAIDILPLPYDFDPIERATP